MTETLSLQALERDADERLPFLWDGGTHTAFLLDASDPVAVANAAAASGARVTAVDADIVAAAARRCWAAAGGVERRALVLESLYELDDDLTALRSKGTAFDVTDLQRGGPGTRATLSFGGQDDLAALIRALWMDCDSAEVWFGSAAAVGRAGSRTERRSPFVVEKEIGCVMAMLDRPDRCLILIANELADSLREAD